MGGLIFEDTLQRARKHDAKHAWWTAHGIEVRRTRFDGKHDVPVSFGDYYTPTSNVVVDTKRDIDEVAQNISRQHARFRRELERAAADGFRLVVLVENQDGVRTVEQLTTWVNGHCRFCHLYRNGACLPSQPGPCERHGKRNKPIQGKRLAKAMLTMQDRYAVRFAFCPPESAAFHVCALLGVRYESICSDCFRYTKGGLCLPAVDCKIVHGPGQQVDGAKILCEEGVPF